MLARFMVVLVAAMTITVPSAAAAENPAAGLFGRQALMPGVQPTSVTFADVNGDGLDDLVSAIGVNEVSWGVSVMPGRASGGFAPAVDSLSGQRLDSFQVVDLTGDGTLDVAAFKALDDGDVTMGAMFGDGTGSFGKPVVTGLPIADEVVLGRFRDSALPWAVVARPDGLEVYRATGFTSYSLESTIAPAGSTHLLAADLDGDGLDELLVADEDGLTLYRDLFPVATHPQAGIRGLRATDTTGDGRPEVLVTAGGGETKVLDGTLAVLRSATAPPSPVQSAAGDLDGDGVTDLATGSRVSPILVHLSRTGKTFVPTTGTVDDVFITDATRDGNTDLLALQTDGSIVEVIEGDGNGGFPSLRTVSATADAAWDLDTADFDGDGKPDVLAAEWDAWAGGLTAGRRAHIMLGDGEGGFTRATSLDLMGTAPSGASAGDFNGDGAPDVAVGDYYGSVSQFLNLGEGAFSARIPLLNCMFSDGVTVGDFNDDGYDDVAAICRAAIFRDHVSFLVGSPVGLVKGPQVALSSTAQSYEMATGDVNGDGNLDVAWASFDHYNSDPSACASDPACLFQRSDRPIAYFLGLGNGLFEPTARHYVVGETLVDVELADLDGDGRDEIITPLTFLDEIQVASGKADGSLGEPWRVRTYDYPRTAYAGDVTGDGRADVVAGHGPDALVVMAGTKDGLGDPVAFSARRPVSEMALGDFDLDGDVDVVAGEAASLESFLTGI